uniref:SAM domain, SH3 domain and nuclear localization signals 1 n=1 Tax=Latimeria chalumnae TaxID=7897 RepID=M3XLJ1_LATCH|nr:PREDICTED: SAM domain-containing protein SAMSN-1 [Latimeria chalumnae]|eukprot:XP_014354176.1 PREDICTED: SAM domain-containing protein SAMSN-1 [Latimeria chalumnae]
MSKMLRRKHSNVSDKEKGQKPKRTSSFGSFDRFRHHNSPTKPEEQVQLNPDEADNTADPEEQSQSKASTNSGSLGKKMRAISLTMRKKMGKRYIKALSEEMNEDTDGDSPYRDSDTPDGPQSEKISLKASDSMESLYSLNSGRSSSSGITSGSDGISNRDSLRFDEEVPYTGPFCGRASVHTDFTPSPYDTDSLKLKKGDIIDIISKSPMGTWTGLLHNKVGSFKFIYVELISEEIITPRKIKTRRRSKRAKPKTLEELLQRLSLQELTSTLLLNGYQSLEELRDLKESHLVELNVTDPEHRMRLLTAVEHLLEDDNENSDQEVGDTQAQNTLTVGLKYDHLQSEDCPRDSGCYITLESSDNGKEDLESESLTVLVGQVSATDST